MATLTTTITSAPPIRLAAHLNSATDPLQFFKGFLKEECLTAEQRQLVQDLIDSYEPEDAPSLLVLLLSNILYPAIETCDEENLFALVVKTKDALKAILSPSTDVDLFIKETMEQSDSDFELEQLAQKINALVEKKDDQLCILGDQINQSIEDAHAFLKKRLITIIESRESALNGLIGQNNTQVAKINYLKTQLEDIARDLKKIGNDYAAQQQNYRKLLKRAHELLRSCK